jgi:hypothetical protein
MTTSHDSYEDLAGPRRDTADYRRGFAEAQSAFLIGHAVRERRLALGLVYLVGQAVREHA